MLNILITIFGVLCLIVVWVILYDSNRFVVVRNSFSSDKLRRSGRAVVLADLHNKRYGKNNELLLKAIDDCKPDFVLVAGDILTAKPGASLEPAIEFMQKLAAKYPVYYGSGNHEHRLKLYPENYKDMSERYEKALAEAGVIRLVNNHVTLEEYGITIYGSEINREFYKRFKVSKMPEDYMRSILGRCDTETYTILLAHNPDYFPQYGAWGADLVCSGHVHGGVARVPFWGKGMISPSLRLFPQYDGGAFSEGKSTMLLSRGLGMHTIPFRLFNPAELLLVEFCAQK
ncbi:MAG: hypothetical protein E7286_10210 [Lachnospiraceae bacterium]|nr:hypothetical protein [Lachnospiraceae bacterium]